MCFHNSLNNLSTYNLQGCISITMLAPLAEAVLNNTHIVQTLAIQSLVVVGLAIVASALWEFYRRHQKLVDVPVVNLTGWSFDAARRSYISDFASLIEEGYEKVGWVMHCHLARVPNANEL